MSAELRTTPYVRWLGGAHMPQIYFDIRWTEASLGSEWKSLINPKAKASENNWFLINKGTFGNRHYVAKKLFILWGLFNLTFIILFSIRLSFFSLLERSFLSRWWL